MRWLKRLFCVHVWRQSFKVHLVPWMTNYECRKCGKVCAYPPLSFPVSAEPSAAPKVEG